ncbi:hypothetical protein [Methylobacterium iners]|jgi:predicted PurR-regulated permease PerM|uniref:Uncharacterized protein n=1 Tax=Methylobacterium iners TaxID=418707 RepID=A0ABQ4S233_9HYPH|nr:hypothetical protein [Methylobacterium iners]GJD97061.1 hypothetical protein OCOJLMKI_4289 [Methylobacterium iners]
MRLRLILCTLLGLAAAAPASAQLSNSVDSLNRSNERMATQNQIRNIENRQQFENNQTRMQLQRSQDFRPPPGPPQR